MLKAYLEQAFAHSRWADERLLPLIAYPAAPDKARVLMAHILSACQVWADRLLGGPVPPVWPAVEGFDFQQNLELAYRGIERLIMDLDPDYQQVFDYKTSHGDAFSNSSGEILFHLLMHGQYHRGQVNQLLREAGLPTAAMDFILFTRPSPAF